MNRKEEANSATAYIPGPSAAVETIGNYISETVQATSHSPQIKNEQASRLCKVIQAINVLLLTILTPTVCTTFCT